MKVGHALRLLPSLEAVFPLRSLLLASAEPDTRDVWGGSSSYRTVGLHEVDSGELRRQFAAGFRTVTAHLDALYTAFADAMDAEDRDDHAGAVRRLLDAGRSEERLGRFDQANAWFRAALQLAEPLQDQHPEIDALLAIGELTERVGLYQQAARVYQRALALADAAFQAPAASDACAGLGAVATAAGDWRGAQAWYERAMGLAEGSG
ncbi:MAG TPA: tetratricopeptide repeat protein, partial [Gemmatimonadaceae bacterium]|nr:tetratricopeptide repeat protein [Gemmatimonadaceae bacterium]